MDKPNKSSRFIKPLFEIAERAEIMQIAREISILIVEDSVVSSRALISLFAALGNIKPDIAESGANAIKLFINNNYDLIITDINLPDISGINVCQQIRKMSHGKLIPIIGYTTNADLIKDDCLYAGMNNVLNKPATLKNIQNIIDGLNNKRT